jgi:hypothetical protein
MSVRKGDIALITGGPNAGKVVRVKDFVGEDFRWIGCTYSGLGPCWLVHSLGSPLVAEVTSRKTGQRLADEVLMLMPFPEYGLLPLTTGI